MLNLNVYMLIWYVSYRYQWKKIPKYILLQVLNLANLLWDQNFTDCRVFCAYVKKIKEGI
jgi:hypothetical protein